MARPSGVYDWSKFWDVGKCFIYFWEVMGPCWFSILFKEAININEIKPTLNTGLKTFKELQLF